MSETVDNANGQRAVIEVTDFGYDVFFAMLKYLYTGSFDFRGCPNVDATNLLKVADKYNVQELKDAMEICIVDALTIDTVVEILFGFAHAYPLLRKACLAFIGDKFEEVMKTGAISKVEWNDSNWQDHAELMNEILESVNKRKPTIDKVD
ncbi:hypothetical protein BC938DRAFT_483992 [Jimgerdemannia flammicorona]|uniref:BTB domain-containing protein n=1 Tax=Jimgerdemannia flammicorona TaxID=994334 RepID=A0A433QAQ5_9FUNG|nr:hypothetical protein BC938DRAFT_483992 [Jimgerdemannia flammicorona]